MKQRGLQFQYTADLSLFTLLVYTLILKRTIRLSRVINYQTYSSFGHNIYAVVTCLPRGSSVPATVFQSPPADREAVGYRSTV